MAKREWIGNYKLHYVEWYSYKKEWISRTVDLGYCLSHDEAIEKAILFIIRENPITDSRKMYISDGWGNKFKAQEN